MSDGAVVAESLLVCECGVANYLMDCWDEMFGWRWKYLHPSDSAIVKSLRLNGSAMFALLGTRLSICVSCCLLCQAQWDPIKLLSGWWFPDPLLMACVAGSLSQSCMYGSVSIGFARIGVMIAAHASRKYMYALLLANCCSIFLGTDP